MKLNLCYGAMLAATLLLQGCGGGGLIGDETKDKDMLYPSAGTIDLSARPRPSDTAATITTDETSIYDATKKPILLRGATLALGDTPSVTRIAGIKAMKEAGSNVVHLYITENTTDPDLEAALAKVVEQGLLAIITLDSPKLFCSENRAALVKAVDDLWLNKWIGVIAQERFQPYIMINMANGWGPEGIFNPESYGYKDYLETYKALFTKFREAGFKVPLVVDAPCGQDYYAFSNDRARELVGADTAKNVILSVQTDGGRWSSSEKTTTAVTGLIEAGVPFVVGAFSGSAVGEGPVDHMDLMTKAAGDPALALYLPWLTTSDSAAYVVTMPKTANLAGGAEVSTSIYIDPRYLELEKISDADGKQVPKGRTMFTLYAKDASGNGLKLGNVQAKDLRGSQWNKVRFVIPKTAEDIVAANLMQGATSFDLTAVSQIGFQVAANGKAPAVGLPNDRAKSMAAIKLDDLVILPGVPPLYTFKFNNDTESWVGFWGKDQVVAQSNGNLTLLSNAGELVIGSTALPGAIDFSKELLFTIRIKIPASYDIPSAGGQVIGKFGPSSIERSSGLSLAGLPKGEWTDWKVRVDFSAGISAADIKMVNELVFQLWNFPSPASEPVLIDSITVTDVNAKPTKTITDTQYKSSFVKNADGFVVDWGSKSTVSVENGELLLTTPAGDGGVFNKSNINSVNEINFGGGITVKAKVFVPVGYDASNLWMQFILQDGNWNGFNVGSALNIGSFTLGQWTELEFNVKTEDYPANFARTLKPNMFGFQFASTAAGTIKIKDLEIIGQLVVDDAQPTFNLDFSVPAQFDSVKFDFASGSFTQSGLVNARTKSWKIVPFGWMANSWFGNTGDNAVLNLTKVEDKVDLTARGEEIVNSAFGIKATSQAATFPAIAK